jgi:hypothetical protein
MTLGTLKFRLTKMFPGVDADVLNGFIDDRYSEILGVLPWSRTAVHSILQTTAPYSTGTVAVTQGSASVTLTGGTWTSAMTGRAFRVTGRSEFYEFTYASGTTGTLDRVYEGSTGSGVVYKITQAVYPLPSDCRLLEDDAFSSFELGPLQRFSRGELNANFPDRTTTGTPEAWATYMEDGSTPPRMQIELYPVPDAAIGIPFTYIAEGAALSGSTQILQAWIQPAALIEGVMAKVKRHLGDYTGANEHEKQAAKALATMIGQEAHGMGPMQMSLDSYFTSHRSQRTNR